LSDPVQQEIGLPPPGSPLAREYRDVTLGMQRCERTVTHFDAKAYDPEAIASACAMWKTRMTAEYRSTSVFAALAGQLMEANAPIDCTAVVLRLAQDEVRHAHLCGETLLALGGEPSAEAPVDVKAIARHKGVTPEERALRNVIYGSCMSEMVNTARFVDALDTMTDPYLRDVTRVILSDEIVHGQFGFFYLEVWREWLAARPSVRESLAVYLRHAFAVLERTMSGKRLRPRT
jgi:hypothetical protein